MITVPRLFGESVSDRGGAEGSAWVAGLPALFAELGERWGLRGDGAPMNGYHGLVVPVRRGEEALALKVSWVDASIEQEIRALRMWEGRGMVRIVDAAPELGALLLERLDLTRPLSEEPIGVGVATAGDLIRLLAVEADPMPGLPTVADWTGDVGRRLHYAWDRAERPFERRLVNQAVAWAFDLSRTPDGRLVNWDLHYENVLAGERLPWIAIDPKAMVGPPEFGAAQLLWRLVDYLEGPADLAQWTALLVERAGLDPEETRRWTLIRTLEYQLWCLRLGYLDDAARCATLVAWAGY